MKQVSGYKFIDFISNMVIIHYNHQLLVFCFSSIVLLLMLQLRFMHQRFCNKYKQISRLFLPKKIICRFLIISYTIYCCLIIPASEIKRVSIVPVSNTPIFVTMSIFCTILCFTITS